MINKINIIFPHQLFEKSPLLENDYPVYLLEEYLFFNQYNFHQQKLAFHRATMKRYESFLKEKGKTIVYINAQEEISDIQKFIPYIKQKGIDEIHFIDPTDNWLEKRLQNEAKGHKIIIKEYESPLFLNAKSDLQDFFRPEKKKYFQTKFYIEQRKKRNILLETNQKPLGGKWSFDAENRKKYPRKKMPPPVHFPQGDDYFEEAKKYVIKNYKNNIGVINEPLYPTSFEESKKWLHQFLENRFAEFGTYEDAIVAEYSILNHSVLTPMLNVGLISPGQIIDMTLCYAKDNNIPVNSLEGFIRQIIGWREFIRGVYQWSGTRERTKNFWQFNRKIPASFYDGTTGIYPIDITIKKILKTGYCHHIERLMVLGNFMILCEFDPDEVYRWFMELFIDAYDWVMVPNVYGMSQYADGGLMSTKPYISGSNYLKKMSNYPKGEWMEIWDALFWRFMHVHRDFFLKNPRLGMLVRNFDKQPSKKQNNYLKKANQFLSRL